ncbi:hypothetical protein ACEU2D_17735 [Brevibacillus laterosporus]|uniref:hypothetical protein n=1 Tax=Brevibacillus laterosporus TaxID=1465 RepID=UPI0035A5EF71
MIEESKEIHVTLPDGSMLIRTDEGIYLRKIGTEIPIVEDLVDVADSLFQAYSEHHIKTKI